MNKRLIIIVRDITFVKVIKEEFPEAIVLISEEQTQPILHYWITEN